jgi:RNA polymerase sigma-70 factor (ECF subfamily)
VDDEKTWINQAQNGSDEAFTRLVEVYQTPVYNLCYRMLGEPEMAEEAAQETFFKCYRNLGRYDPTRSFATWLLSIAAHHCIDRLRRRRFTSFSIDDEENTFELPDTNAPDPEIEITRREQQAQMQTLLKSLDATDRAAVVMRYWNDCSEVEIAQALSLTVPAVKSRLHRARRSLAKLWEENSVKTNVERRPHESPAF